MFMEQDLKVPHSPLSTHRSESAASAFDPSPCPSRQPQPRFSRSGSRSRSKGRQDSASEIPGRLLFKRQEQPLSSPRIMTDVLHGRYLRTNAKLQKREDTPCKSRREKDLSEGGNSRRQGDLQWVKLQRECQLVQAQNLQLQKTIKSLQSKVCLLEERMAAIDLDRTALREKLSAIQVKEGRGRDRGSNLLKLKQEISKQKQIQVLPQAELLRQQLQQAHTEIKILKDSLKRAQEGKFQAERAMASQRSEREHFLEGVIEELRQQTAKKGEILERMKIQLNVLRVRQARQEEQVEQRCIEELQNVKKKYGNVLRKYHEASQQLAVYRRKEERNGFMGRCERNGEDSLSLSP